MSSHSPLKMYLLYTLCIIAAATAVHTVHAQYGYGQGSYGGGSTQGPAGGPAPSSGGGYTNTGNNPGNNNAPGYNGGGYSQGSYSSGGGGQYGYSQGSYSSGGSNSSGGQYGYGQGSYATPAPSLVQTVASSMWDLGAKTYAAAVSVVNTVVNTINPPKPTTYSLLPSGQYLGSDGTVNQTKPTVVSNPEPVTSTPAPEAVQAAIAAQKAKTAAGIASALTPTQVSILNGAGVDMSNPVAVTAALKATNGMSVMTGVETLQNIEKTTGSSIEAGAAAAAYGQTGCGSDCAAADALRSASGITDPNAYKSSFTKDIGALDQKQQAATQSNVQNGYYNGTQYGYSQGSYQTPTTQPNTGREDSLNAGAGTGSTAGDAQKAEADAAAKAKAEETARMMAINDPVGSGISKTPGAIEQVTAVAADMNKAAAALADAKAKAQNAAIDSDQMQEYINAQKKYDEAQTAYQNTITAAQKGDVTTMNSEAAKVQQTTSDVVYSSSISTHASPNAGSGSTNGYGTESGQQLGQTYSGPKGTPQTGLSTVAKQANVRAQGYAVPAIPATEAEVELMTRMILAENSSIKNADGSINMTGVESTANVIVTRVLTPGYPKNITDVILQPGQFSPANTGLQNLPQYGPGSKDYKEVETMVRSMLDGEVAPIAIDPKTGAGFLNYANPVTVATVPGYSSPASQSWVAQMAANPVSYVVTSAVNSAFQHVYGTAGNQQGYDYTPDDTVAQSTRTFQTTQPSAFNSFRTSPVGKTVETVVAVASDPIGALVGFVGNLFTGTGSNNTTTPTSSGHDNHNPATTTPVVTKPKPASDLTAKATTASKGAVLTATTTEYKFTGAIVRTIIHGENGLPVSDINAHYNDTFYTKLSVDYSCDGTVDASLSFPTPYSVFDTKQDTSQILVSQYLPMTKFGTHCYFFTTDQGNVIDEQDEQNNVSNVVKFMVTQGSSTAI